MPKVDTLKGVKSFYKFTFNTPGIFTLQQYLGALLGVTFILSRRVTFLSYQGASHFYLVKTRHTFARHVMRDE